MNNESYFLVSIDKEKEIAVISNLKNVSIRRDHEYFGTTTDEITFPRITVSADIVYNRFGVDIQRLIEKYITRNIKEIPEEDIIALLKEDGVFERANEHV